MMKRTSLLLATLMLLGTFDALAEWERIGPGVEYQKFTDSGLVAHVTRVDLDDDRIRLITSNESEKGMRTSDWAKRKNALVAINADFFDEKHKPIGLAIGGCGSWSGTSDTRREGVVAIGEDRLEIRAQSHVMDPVPGWVEQAVSGWPLLVDGCRAFGSSALPGSDAFTRSPHPRTAVGLSGDTRTLYLVVVDGRLEGIPGVTLAELAEFMQDQLGVCTAINLDGGGSSVLVIDEQIRSTPSDGRERWVANHLGVVLEEDYEACPAGVKQARRN